MIFVSPMVRALQTAFLLFKDHPNFANIKVIIDPDLREHIQSSCDIPQAWPITLKEYSRLFKGEIDTKLMDEMRLKAAG